MSDQATGRKAASRALDCVVPPCRHRMEGANDEELFRSARAHADQAHADTQFTDEQIRDVIRSDAYDVT